MTPWIRSLGRLIYQTMKLSDLVGEFPYRYSLLNGDAEIRGIVSDSRQVQPGYLFVALTGGISDCTMKTVRPRTLAPSWM